MKLSIVTPSFRHSDWLRLCVASVADQAGVEVEHIVQDAQSDDGTQEWLAQDRRVRAYFEKDQGMYDAINRGWRRATGEILAYLNCDEQYLPGGLRAVEEFFRQQPQPTRRHAEWRLIWPLNFGFPSDFGFRLASGGFSLDAAGHSIIVNAPLNL